jgi:hypothetical protein
VTVGLPLKKISGKNTIVVLVLALTAVVVYYPAFSYYFLLEDFSLIYKAKNNFNIQNIFITPFFENHFYRPLTHAVLYLIAYRVFDLSAFGFHCISLAFFFGTAFLIYKVIRTLNYRADAAFIAVLFYATRAEAFSLQLFWIAAGFQEGCMAFFSIAALLCYLLFIKRNIWAWYVASIGCFCLSLISKETALVVPCIIAIVHICYDERYVKNIKINAALLMPYCMLSGLILSRNATLLLGKSPSSEFYQFNFSLSTMFDNLLFYVQTCFNHPLEYVAAIIIISAAVLLSRRRKMILCAAGIFCAGIATFIFSANHQQGYYLSLSMAGASVLVAEGFASWCDRVPQSKYFSLIVLISVMLATGYASAREKDRILAPINTEIVVFYKHLTHAFPSFPDKSLIYIKNMPLIDYNWPGGRKYGIKLLYENVYVYCEGVDENWPPDYRQVYYFDYRDSRLHYEY